MAAKPNTTRVLSLEEVAKHDKDDDAWIIVDGNVYNATPYLSNHPGGKDIILQHKGGDATQGFHDTGHSSSAKKDLANLQVGVLSEESRAEVAKQAKEKADKAGPSLGVIGFALAGLGLAGALAYQFLGVGK